MIKAGPSEGFFIWSTVIKARKRHLLRCCAAVETVFCFSLRRQGRKKFILANKTLSHEAKVQSPIITPPVFDHLPLPGEEFVVSITKYKV